MLGKVALLALGTMSLSGCATDVATEGDIAQHNERGVTIQDEEGRRLYAPVDRTTAVVIPDFNAKLIIDPDVVFPDNSGGIIAMTSADIDFYLMSVSRWLDEDLGELVAEGEDGEVREWPLE